MASNDMLANSLALVAAARERGVVVMHAAISFAEGYPEIPAEAYGILAGVKGSNAFRKGSWGAEIIDELQPEAEDIVVEGKRGLDFILRARGIETVALAGFLTNCCVESTMRSAYERAYRVVTLTDCTATLSAEEQRLATEKNFPMFSLPMTHDSFLAGLA